MTLSQIRKFPGVPIATCALWVSSNCSKIFIILESRSVAERCLHVILKLSFKEFIKIIVMKIDMNLARKLRCSMTVISPKKISSCRTYPAIFEILFPISRPFILTSPENLFFWNSENFYSLLTLAFQIDNISSEKVEKCRFSRPRWTHNSSQCAFS